MLDNGVYATVSEIGDAENISKSYVSRILRLALLTPDIVEEILAGSADQGVVLEQLERPLPASWEKQRQRSSYSTSERVLCSHRLLEKLIGPRSARWFGIQALRWSHAWRDACSAQARFGFDFKVKRGKLPH